MADNEKKNKAPTYVPVMIGLVTTLVVGIIVYLVFFMSWKTSPKKFATVPQAAAPPSLQATTAAGSQAWNTAVQQIGNLEAQRRSALYSRLGSLLASMGSNPQEYARAMAQTPPVAAK